MFFNDLSNPDGSLALTNEGPSLDSCLGHSAPTSMPGRFEIKASSAKNKILNPHL